MEEGGGGVWSYMHVMWVAYFVFLTDFEDVPAGSECVVAVEHVSERRVLEIHEDG
jgi:hypothetical protein